MNQVDRHTAAQPTKSLGALELVVHDAASPLEAASGGLGCPALEQAEPPIHNRYDVMKMQSPGLGTQSGPRGGGDQVSRWSFADTESEGEFIQMPFNGLLQADQPTANDNLGFPRMVDRATILQ